MAASTPRSFFSTTSVSRRFLRDSLNLLFFLLIVVAILHFFYVSSSKLYVNDLSRGLARPRLNQFPKIDPQAVVRIGVPQQIISQEPVELHEDIVMQDTTSNYIEHLLESLEDVTAIPSSSSSNSGHETPAGGMEVGPDIDNDNDNKNDDVYHDINLFMEEYSQMNKTLKIYTYPHKKDDPFANVLLPSTSEPGGNYASESYFKKSLFNSHFLTNDPSKADLFYLPFSIASLRHDKRVGVGGIQHFVKNYVRNISRSYPYWNRTGGADHFYVACHSVGRTAMEKAVQVKLNAIQVVCSSSYFLSGYVAHKDASIPQIWPRKGRPPTRSPSGRKNLAFYAGAMNSRVRKSLIKEWGNDSEISVHKTRLKTPYSEALLGSKFCIHAKGFEVNTARIGDALYYGCVPVVLADHYDLPYADILNWNSFSVVLPSSDIPLMKKILKEINADEYLKLQGNVVRVQKHFQWHDLGVDYDAFYMVMYELWLRRSHVRIPFD